jgi:hypothetical protein
MELVLKRALAHTFTLSKTFSNVKVITRENIAGKNKSQMQMNREISECKDSIKPDAGESEVS